jgi:8-oxo-dGTP pyrophosphatase MutT (NUDIX family)
MEVLMGRRAARHRFVPHHYVFPGGRLDRGDATASARTRLPREVERTLQCNSRMAHALAIAAVRETYEETGLALGAPGAWELHRLEYWLRAITPSSSPIRFHARFFAAEAKHFKGQLRGNGELLDLDWRPLDECLKLPIVDVTEFILRRLAAGQRFDDVSLFSFRSGRVIVSPRARRKP